MSISLNLVYNFKKGVVKMNKIDKKKNFIVNFTYALIVGVIAFLVIKYAFVWLLPFVIGFAIAYILKPLIVKFSNKLKISRNLSAGIILTIFYLTVGAAITLLILKIAIYIKDLVLTLPNIYTNSIEPAVYDLFYKGDTIIQNLDPELVDSLREIVLSLTQSLGSALTNLSTKLVIIVSSAVSSVPGFLVFILFLVISSYFLAIDYSRITSFMTRQIPNNVLEIIYQIKECISTTVFKFLKAYVVLITLTFIEMLIGLKILGVSNVVLIASITAIVDVLPILGTGSVLVPWALFEIIIRRNFMLGLGIILLYILITVIRNIVEPKLVGKEIGLEPVLVLACMYLGLKVIGIMGMFILPLVLIVLIDLNKTGKIKLFK